jgi:hypothetical protein
VSQQEKFAVEREYAMRPRLYELRPAMTTEEGHLLIMASSAQSAGDFHDCV